MSIARAKARKPVSRDLLGTAFETYHERYVVPLIRAQDRAILLLGAAVIVLAGAVVYLLAYHVG